LFDIYFENQGIEEIDEALPDFGKRNELWKLVRLGQSLDYIVTIKLGFFFNWRRNHTRNPPGLERRMKDFVRRRNG
jgi:hypothetical protein